MTASHPAVLQTIHADGRELRLQYMTPAEAPALLAFARSLRPHDLLFLPTDISSPEGIDELVEGLGTGRIGVILALDGDQVVGFSSVVRSATSWMRHIAEISVIVSEPMRHHGFGRELTEEAFRIAEDLGVTRMLAQMTLDQQSGIDMLRGLGFTPIAILHDHVIDADERTYDLLLMHQDVARFADTLRRLDADAAPKA